MIAITPADLEASVSSKLYEALRKEAKVMPNPPLKIEKWESNPGSAFGGDIKIDERKADTAPCTEADTPEYLRDRRITVVVVDPSKVDDEPLHKRNLLKKDNKISTKKVLIDDMILDLEAMLDFSDILNIIEVKVDIGCPLSKLHSWIVKQLFCQEYTDKAHVLVETEPYKCSLRFFVKALGTNKKKFLRTVRSVLEIHELATRVHVVGLKYNPNASFDFEHHITVPQGLVHRDDKPE